MGKVRLTLRLEDALVRRVRAKAREHGTTVNEIIRDHIAWLASPAFNPEVPTNQLNVVDLTSKHDQRTEKPIPGISTFTDRDC